MMVASAKEKTLGSACSSLMRHQRLHGMRTKSRPNHGRLPSTSCAVSGVVAASMARLHVKPQACPFLRYAVPGQARRTWGKSYLRTRIPRAVAVSGIAGDIFALGIRVVYKHDAAH